MVSPADEMSHGRDGVENTERLRDMSGPTGVGRNHVITVHAGGPAAPDQSDDLIDAFNPDQPGFWWSTKKGQRNSLTFMCCRPAVIVLGQVSFSQHLAGGSGARRRACLVLVRCAVALGTLVPVHGIGGLFLIGRQYGVKRAPGGR